MWPNPQFPAELVTFPKEILNGNLYFLCSAKTQLLDSCELHFFISNSKNLILRTLEHCWLGSLTHPFIIAAFFVNFIRKATRILEMSFGFYALSSIQSDLNDETLGIRGSWTTQLRFLFPSIKENEKHIFWC